jgi:hypothetical protein
VASSAANTSRAATTANEEFTVAPGRVSRSVGGSVTPADGSDVFGLGLGVRSAAVEGPAVGATEAAAEGAALGDPVGCDVGDAVGRAVGVAVGRGVGVGEGVGGGVGVGAAVGTGVGGNDPVVQSTVTVPPIVVRAMGSA